MKVVPVEVYSRVVGYFRPVKAWNKGKKEEFAERLPYSLSKCQGELNGRGKERAGGGSSGAGSEGNC